MDDELFLARLYRMVADAAINFDYRHNFTIIKNSATHNDYYHFGTHLIAPYINQWHVNHLDMLNAFIAYFNDKVSRSSELSSAYNIVLPTVAEADNCRIKSLPSFSESEEKQRAFLNEVAIKKELVLSRRQNDCIRLLIRGMSAKEIARELNLSHRTVEDHLLALKCKLKAKNKAELIAKGLEL